MGLIAQAASGAGNLSPSDPNAWVPTSAMSYPSTAGVRVGERTATSLPEYYACIRAIAEDIAKLPLILYRRGPDGRTRERARNVPLFTTLHSRPNPSSTAMTFREVMTSWALGWGNAYAEIVRGPRGMVDLYPIHPAFMVPRKNDDGSVEYDLYGSSGKPKETFSSDDILHVRGLGSEVLGYSVFRLAAESIGLGLAEQRMAASFFGNNAHPGLLFRHPGAPNDKAQQNIKRLIKEGFAQENAHTTMVLWEGMDVTKMSIPPEEAQFLESRRFSVETMARWFRMPPHKIQHLERATFSNVEHMAIEYVQDTLMPWAERWEQEIEFKLIPRESSDEFFVEHSLEGLLRGDQASRASFASQLFNIGAISQNEIRERENMNPIPGGDQYFVPVNLVSSREMEESFSLSDRFRESRQPPNGSRTENASDEEPDDNGDVNDE